MTDALLTALEARSNARGLVLASEADILRELETDRPALLAAFDGLAAKGVIEVLTPPPFLVVRLKEWSSRERNTTRRSARLRAPLHRGYSHSFQQHAIRKSKAMATENGGAGEGEALLEEVLATLGESDPSTFRPILRHYPATRIRAALNRVRSTPPESIRKSRTALFRFLLSRTK